MQGAFVLAHMAMKPSQTPETTSVSLYYLQHHTELGDMI